MTEGAGTSYSHTCPPWDAWTISVSTGVLCLGNWLVPAVLSKVCGQTFECVYPLNRAVGDGQNLHLTAFLLWLIREDEQEAKTEKVEHVQSLFSTCCLAFKREKSSSHGFPFCYAYE